MRKDSTEAYYCSIIRKPNMFFLCLFFSPNQIWKKKIWKWKKNGCLNFNFSFSCVWTNKNIASYFEANWLSKGKLFFEIYSKHVVYFLSFLIRVAIQEIFVCAYNVFVAFLLSLNVKKWHLWCNWEATVGLLSLTQVSAHLCVVCL